METAGDLSPAVPHGQPFAWLQRVTGCLAHGSGASAPEISVYRPC